MDSDHYNSSGKHSSQSHRHQSNPTDLLSSAKVVAGAAKSALHHETDKVDMGTVAGAAADLLGAASHYAKLDEGKFGTYVEKAENYLHQYHSSHSAHSSTAAAAAHSSSTHSAGQTHSEGGFEDYTKPAHSSSTHSSSETHSEGGFEDYMKPAHSSSTHSSSETDSEGGFEDYMKMAQGFLKKH